MKNLLIKILRKYTLPFAAVIAAILTFLNLNAAIAKTDAKPVTSVRYEKKDHIISGEPAIVELKLIEKNPLETTESSRYFLTENPRYTGAKTWENYKAISNKASKQYKLQTIAETDSYGLRKLDGRYLIAIGTYFQAPVGTYVDVFLANGTIIPCIVGDIKSDAHTDRTRVYTTHSMCATEFICDAKIRKYSNGDVSSVFPEWASKADSILVYKYNYFEDGPVNENTQIQAAYNN